MTDTPLHIAQVMEATAGGSRKHLRLVVQALCERGHAVDLYLSAELADPDFDRDLELYRELGCFIEVLPMAKYPGWGDWQVYRRLCRSLAQRRPQVVHTHCAKAGLLGRLAARKAVPQARLVHTPHSFFFEGLRRPIRRRVGVAMERWLGARTDGLFCIAEAERRTALAENLIPDTQITVGRNGLPEGFSNGLLDRSDARAELGLADGCIAIGMCARLVEKKRHIVLLMALSKLPAELPVTACLFGEGPMEPILRRAIARLDLADRVKLLGYRPDAERYLPGMDVAVLPSLYEGLPYQLLEALGAGLPLIASAIPGHRFDEPDNPIRYVQPDDVDGLASSLRELAADEALRRHLGAQGPGWVRRHFSQRAQVDALLDFYWLGPQLEPLGRQGKDLPIGEEPRRDH